MLLQILRYTSDEVCITKNHQTYDINKSLGVTLTITRVDALGEQPLMFGCGFPPPPDFGRQRFYFIVIVIIWSQPYHHIIISPYHHIIISSHDHIIISYHHIIPSCHHIIISSYHHIIISSYHIIISSYHHIIISSYRHISISSYHHISTPKKCKSVWVQKSIKQSKSTCLPLHQKS